MPDFPGVVTTFARGLKAKIAASTVVSTMHRLYTDEQGGAYVGDGTTTIKNLSPLLRFTDGDGRFVRGQNAGLFGITCDGTTDDAAAWNAIPAGSGDIYCTGNSRISGPITIPNKTMIHWLHRDDGWIANSGSAAWSKTIPAVSSIVTTGSQWTVTFAAAHGLSAGMIFALSGFVPTLYNTTCLISSVVDAQTVIVADPTAPGTITTTGTATYCPIGVSIGGPGANVFSAGVTGGTTNMNSVPNSIGVAGSSLQEKSGAFDHVSTYWMHTGVLLSTATTRGNQNFHCSNLESYMSNLVVNPTTTVASGSNAVDLNATASGFTAGTGVLNVPAGAIAAQKFTAPGVLKVATSGTYVTVRFTGISPGTGPSGQDQLTGCWATPGQVSTLSTGGSVMQGVGTGITLRGTGNNNIGLRGHTSVVCNSFSSLMAAGVRADGVGSVKIDLLHTEEVIVGTLLGARTAVRGATIDTVEGGFSAGIPTVDTVRICSPQDGTTNVSITCLAVAGANGVAVNDEANNHAHPVSTDQSLSLYSIGYGSKGVSSGSQSIMCSSLSRSAAPPRSSHGMNFSAGVVAFGAAPQYVVNKLTGSATLSNTSFVDLFTVTSAAVATMFATPVSNLVKIVSNATSSTANVTIAANTGQTVPSITLTPGQSCRLIFDGTNWQSI